MNGPVPVTTDLILQVLGAKVVELEALRIQVAQLEMKNRELDEAWTRQADRTVAQAITVDQLRGHPSVSRLKDEPEPEINHITADDVHAALLRKANTIGSHSGLT
jgi:hypothetical protein